MATGKNISSIKKTVEVKLTLGMSKDLADLTDLISSRVYIMEGVEDVTATLMEPEQEEYCAPIMQGFDLKIQAFNKLYRLPCPPAPSIPDRTRAETIMRIERFMSVLREELDEGKDIINLVDSTDGKDAKYKVLTDIADWLGDIIVYCASELAKYGLATEDVLGIIMASNMSKLGEDGKPIYDERGKVMKGPGYWQPEPMIERMIRASIRAGGGQM